MLGKFVKVLKNIFKGPVPTHPKKTRTKVLASTSHTRYATPLKKRQKVKNAKVKNSARKVVGERRSAKSYVSSKATKSKKSTVQKPIQPLIAKKSKALAKTKKPPHEFYVGEITHYFAKISVVVVKVDEHPLLIADTIIVRGSSTFSQKVQSLQVESKDVRFARKGELVGLQVIQPAKPGDKVYKIKK